LRDDADALRIEVEAMRCDAAAAQVAAADSAATVSAARGRIVGLEEALAAATERADAAEETAAAAIPASHWPTGRAKVSHWIEDSSSAVSSQPAVVVETTAAMVDAHAVTVSDSVHALALATDPAASAPALSPASAPASPVAPAVAPIPVHTKISTQGEEEEAETGAEAVLVTMTGLPSIPEDRGYARGGAAPLASTEDAARALQAAADDRESLLRQLEGARKQAEAAERCAARTEQGLSWKPKP